MREREDDRLLMVVSMLETADDRRFWIAPRALRAVSTLQSLIDDRERRRRGGRGQVSGAHLAGVDDKVGQASLGSSCRPMEGPRITLALKL